MISRAIIYESFGNPWEKRTKFKFVDNIYYLVKFVYEEVGELAADAVRVRFLASPINPSDLNQIEGTYPIKPSGGLPAVGGNEGVARVEEFGKLVEGLAKGDLVVPATPALGCWRDFANLKQSDLIKISEKWTKLPLEVLATINVNPPTAYRLLKDFAELEGGDLVVQNGANSAVGRLVIQMASIMGAKTINIIRDRVDYAELAKELMELDPKGGASVVKSDDLKDLKGVEAKLGLNCVGGGAVADMSRVMNQDGVIVTYGAMSRRPLTIPAGPLIFKNLSLKGFWISEWYKKAAPAQPSKMLEDILGWYEAGQLKPVKSFWLNAGEEKSIREFVREVGEGKVIGKGKCIIKYE